MEFPHQSHTHFSACVFFCFLGVSMSHGGAVGHIQARLTVIWSVQIYIYMIYSTMKTT